MRPKKNPPPEREWKLLYLNVSLCFVYFVFVFFVFLNLRLCLGERGNKNVRCRKLLLSESREGNALPPNYLYRQLSILHTLDCYFIFLSEWHQSNILKYQKIILANDWMVWILIRKWEDFPDVTLVKRPFFCGSPKNSSKFLWGITQIWWTCWCEMEMSFLNLELLPSVNSSASTPLTR